MALALALAAALLAAGRADEPRYYVSSSHGSDANDGQTPSSAWQSLRRANQTTLPPGTQLLLRRGDVWTGEMLQLSVRGERGRPVRISAYGDIGAARPLIQRQNKTTDIAMLLDDPSFVVIDGLAVSTAKIGLYLRYWQSYGHKSVSVSNCTFDEIDDPEFDPYTMAREGIFAGHDVSWSSGIMVGGQLASLDEPGTVLTDFNVTHCVFTSVAVGVQVAVGDWNSPAAPGNPPPFGRVENVLLSDLTQTGALQGIVALNYVAGVHMTRLNTFAGGGQRLHLPAGSAGGFLWYCQNVLIDYSRFGHERRVEPTPDGEGVDFEGGNDNVIFRNNVVDYNWGPGMLVMDHGPGSNNSNFWVEDSTFVGNGQHPQCCSNPKESYCGAQQCTHKQISWNNPYLVASGVRRCGFFSSANVTAFGPAGMSAPSSVTGLRQASLDSVITRPVSWNFSSTSSELLGWSAHNANISRSAGKLVGQVTAPAVAEPWLESPLTWMNPFDTPLVELTMWVDQPGVHVCVAWVTEADPLWNEECTTQAATKTGKCVCSLRAEVPTEHTASAVRVDLRDSSEWGGIITAFRLVLDAPTPFNVSLAALETVATREGSDRIYARE